MPLSGFYELSFTHEGATRRVFRRGSGPAVIVMHEIPGITPEVARFATRVADHGFTVMMPHLFGEVAKPFSRAYALAEIARACVSREFSVWAANESSPVTDWLRALCRFAHGEVGGKGVGAIGMCLTGNFALSMLIDPVVLAPVLSQPSLPFPIGKERRSGLHISDRELATIRARVEQGPCVLGLRFTEDPAVPPQRFERLRRELGDGFRAIEIDSSAGNPHGIRASAHSVLTTDLVDREGHPTRAAAAAVLAFFDERLK
jgi:dienelactone hydrolase